MQMTGEVFKSKQWSGTTPAATWNQPKFENAKLPNVHVSVAEDRYIPVPMVNINSNAIPNIGRAGAAILGALPPFLTESYALAKDQIENDMVNDSKKLGVFAFLSSAISHALGWPFWLIIIGIVLLAALESAISVMKRFRLTNVDYAPIAKVQVLIVAVFLFLACSVGQVLVDILLWNTQGVTYKQLLEEAPTWVKSVGNIVNIQTLGGYFIIGFYINTMKKMFIKGAGVENPKPSPSQTNISE